MKRTFWIAVAPALFSLPASAVEATQDTQVFVTVSMPKETAPAFRKSLEDPGRRKALEACKETAAESKKMSPDFPRPLKPKERKLFERLLFTCDGGNPDIFTSFGAASRDAAGATGAPIASVRVVFDTIPVAAATPPHPPSSAKPRAAPRAAAAACTLQFCYNGDLRRVNNVWACTCQ